MRVLPGKKRFGGRLPKAAGSEGFTLIELAIVVMIIGVLAAFVVPNYFRFADRARDARVYENMHAFHTAVEVFAVDNLGTYPVAADEAAVVALLPDGTMPTNPFTEAATALVWGADPASPGEIGMTTLANGYVINGHGKHELLSPIQSGQ